MYVSFFEGKMESYPRIKYFMKLNILLSRNI